ncbi:MAG: hypothetical protein EA407_07440 [Rhodobacteraceae bacterium]|nr:MAG: hypothetical protein EA407_07440 [Paracoccaceae bacterium]
MTRKLPKIIGVLALTMTPVTVLAQGMGNLPSFETLDRDQSGAVTFEEFTGAFEDMQGAWQEQAIARLMEHADDEGKLDEAALRAGIANLQSEWSGSREDRNPERRAQMLERMFDRIDANDDGEISAKEYVAFTGHMAKRMERRGPREGRSGGGRW